MQLRLQRSCGRRLQRFFGLQKAQAIMITRRGSHQMRKCSEKLLRIASHRSK